MNALTILFDVVVIVATVFATLTTVKRDPDFGNYGDSAELR